jgi:signal transduction histidine kinase
VNDEAAAWEARFRRERSARKEAERLLEERARALWESKQSLERSLVELQAAQAALVQREKLAAVGSLVAGVAHEINTPLGVALTAASFAVEAADALDAVASGGKLTRSGLTKGLADLREAAHLVWSNVDRAGKLVRSFKMVAVDQQSELPRRVDLAELLRDHAASLRPLVKTARVELQVEAESGTIVVSAGPLGQVITNLVQNSCVHAFSDDGRPRRVTVRGSLREDGLQLEVADDGRGISEDVRARIFEPFYTTRRDAGGSGLGLHIVENIVVQHFGGTLEVESEPDRGTAFRMRLPWREPTLRRAAAR